MTGCSGDRLARNDRPDERVDDLVDCEDYDARGDADGRPYGEPNDEGNEEAQDRAEIRMMPRIATIAAMNHALGSLTSVKPSPSRTKMIEQLMAVARRCQRTRCRTMSRSRRRHREKRSGHDL